jgi:hypothetical protein
MNILEKLRDRLKQLQLLNSFTELSDYELDHYIQEMLDILEGKDMK